MSEGKGFWLVIHETYRRMGFFNVPVRVDRLIRSSEGDVVINLQGLPPFHARVDRHANPNGTARIMGGTVLRDWFQKFPLKSDVYVDLSSKAAITISPP